MTYALPLRKSRDRTRGRVKMRRLPRELKQGLKPIRIGLMQSDQEYSAALERACAERSAEVTHKLEILRQWYGIAAGPNCWRDLCLVMATELFPGFRDKAGRKPRKWTMGTLAMLSGEMRRQIDEGSATQELAAQKLAAREPWKSFLVRGRWRKAHDQEPSDTLLEQYTHTARRYRMMGENAYLWHVSKGTVQGWDDQVRDWLQQPGE